MRRPSKRSRAIDFRRGLAAYTAERRLAVGGMAEVWKGRATFQDGQVLPIAIKRVRPELDAHSIYRDMFRDEARLGMLLRHPHIARVYDARELRGIFIIIMELVDGPSLRALMARGFERGTPMPVEGALAIGIGVAKALCYAHDAIDDLGRNLDIIHRDVSPHNILLGTDGAVKLMDFGLANASANLTQRNTDQVGGKLGYLAPEIIVEKRASPAIDVFALGVTLWEALTGTRLFRATDERETVQKLVACQVPSVRRFNPRVPETFEQVLQAVLCKDPAGRPTSRQLADALRDVAQREGWDTGRECVERLVRLHERVEDVARRPQRVSGSLSMTAASKLERELTELAAEGAVVVPSPSEDDH